jgi:dihydrofolate reductase
MEKVMIAAKAANNVIGKDNSLPWHLPADYDFFLRAVDRSANSLSRFP